MIPHERIAAQALNSNRARDASYKSKPGREAWETIPVEEIVHAICYKVNRAIQPNVTLDKRLDDTSDAYNFVAALFERLAP